MGRAQLLEAVAPTNAFVAHKRKQLRWSRLALKRDLSDFEHRKLCDASRRLLRKEQFGSSRLAARLYPSRCVYGVADHRIVEATLRAHVTDARLTCINPNPNLHLKT